MVPNIHDQLKAALAENEELKASLQHKEYVYQDLQDEYNYKCARAADLDQQCQEKKIREAELLQVLEATRSPDAMQEKFIVKCLQNAEYSFQLGKLQQALEHVTGDRNLKKKEIDSNKLVISDLSEKNSNLHFQLEECWSKLNNLRQERDINKKLIQNLSQVISKLPKLSVSKDSGKSNTTVLALSGQWDHQSFEDMKSKIQAIEHDRQLLMRECDFLKEDNSSKDAKIAALETAYHELNIQRIELGQGLNQTNEFSHGVENGFSTRSDTSVDAVDGDRNTFTVSHTPAAVPDTNMHDDLSDASSFSSVEPPDIPIEQFEKVKRELEEALAKIRLMESELQKNRQNAERDNLRLEQGKIQLGSLRKQLEAAMEKRGALARQLALANGEIDLARNRYDGLKKDHSEAKETQRNEYEKLKQEYDEELERHAQKYKSMEKTFNESMEIYTNSCEKLKQEHDAALELKVIEHKTLEEEYKKAIEAHADRFETLKLEYDSVLKQQIKPEDELRRKQLEELYEKLQQKYNVAIMQITKLEQELDEAVEEAKQAGESHGTKQQTEQHVKVLHEAIRQAYEIRKYKRELATTAREKYDVLKQEYEQALAEHAKFKKEQQTEKEKVENDGNNRYKQLDREYNNALATISQLERVYNDALTTISRLEFELEQELTEAVQEAENSDEKLAANGSPSTRPERKKDKDGRINCRTLEQITKLEKELLEAKKAIKNTSCDHNARSDARPQEDPNDIWRHRLIHQQKLRGVHTAVRTRLNASRDEAECSIENSAQSSQKVSREAYSYYRHLHLRNLIGVHNALLRNQAMSKLESNSQGQMYEPVKKCAETQTVDQHNFQQDAKKELDKAKRKLAARDRDLREVISQYKKLEQEHTATMKKMQAFQMEQQKEHFDISQDTWETELRDVINHYRKLEKEHEATLSKITNLETRGSNGGSTDKSFKGGLLSNIFRKASDVHNPMNTSSEGKNKDSSDENNCVENRADSKSNRQSADCSRGVPRHADVADSASLLSALSFGTMSKEGRDEKIEHVPSQSKHVQVSNMQLLKQEHGQAKATIATIQHELNRAKRAAEKAKSKQASREGHLLDVIYQYKKLQHEYDAMVAKAKQTKGELQAGKGRDQPAEIVKLREENDAAIAKVSAIEKELNSAKQLADGARMKQVERENHLRDVIFQYKQLQNEHAAVLLKVGKMKQELDAATGCLDTQDIIHRQDTREQAADFNSTETSDEDEMSHIDSIGEGSLMSTNFEDKVKTQQYKTPIDRCPTEF